MKGCPTNLSTSHEMGWWGPRILFLSELARGSCAKIALPHQIGVVMALRAVPTPDESSLTVNVYDGTRQAFPAGTKCSLPRLRRQSEPAGVAGETSVFARLHPPVLRQLRGQLHSDLHRRQVS